MTESDTRSKLIDPKLKESNWTENNIVREYFLTTQLAKCLCVWVAKFMRLNILPPFPISFCHCSLSVAVRLLPVEFQISPNKIKFLNGLTYTI